MAIWPIDLLLTYSRYYYNNHSPCQLYWIPLHISIEKWRIKGGNSTNLKGNTTNLEINKLIKKLISQSRILSLSITKMTFRLLTMISTFLRTYYLQWDDRPETQLAEHRLHCISIDDRSVLPEAWQNIVSFLFPFDCCIL